eukprot:2499564-Amphidinium_carterae.1
MASRRECCWYKLPTQTAETTLVRLDVITCEQSNSHVDVEELNREWEQVWQEPAVSHCFDASSFAASNWMRDHPNRPAGLEEFHQNFDILQRHIGGFQLAAVDEQNAHRPKPDVLILIFGTEVH